MTSKRTVYVVIIWILFCCGQVTCPSVFELSVMKLNNNRGVTADGRCCTGRTTTPPCTDGCSTLFSVCLIHHTRGLSFPHECTYGSGVSDTYTDNNVGTGRPDGRVVVRVPIHFSWPGQLIMVVDAWHDLYGNQTKNDASQIIIQTILSTYLEPSFSWEGETTITPTTEIQFQYRLVCSGNYYGSGCDVLCRPRDDQFGHYTCDGNGTKVCQHGWHGTFCDKPRCSDDCIRNGGICDRPHECRCSLGWHGPDCGECDLYTGCLHGYCWQPYQCICRTGWSGHLCDVDTQYCKRQQPCLHGGTCTSDVIGNYTCICPGGFGGNNCQYAFCYDGYCLNEGSCQTRNGVRECSCLDGYHGDRCEHAVVACTDIRCEHGGTCVPGEFGGACACPEYYTGTFCEQRISVCNSQPCKNDGKCMETDTNDFVCMCPPRYGGADCSKLTDPCASTHCQNGANCVVNDASGNHYCACSDGFTGDLCETPLDPCLGVVCSNGGTCKTSPMDNGFICSCVKGYHGEVCELEMHPCASNPCHNGGLCKSYISTFLCICPLTHNGRLCEYEVMASDDSHNDKVSDDISDVTVGDTTTVDYTNGSSISSISKDYVETSGCIRVRHGNLTSYIFLLLFWLRVMFPGMCK